MSDPSWDATENNIKWVMLNREADPEAKKEMLEALAVGNMSAAGHFRGGFMKGQRADSQTIARNLFDVCFNQDARRAYNIGRQINQQPPI